MKRHELLNHLQKSGCQFLREGKKHSVYFNIGTKKATTVPRHTEISKSLTLKICRDLGIPYP